MNNKPQTNNSRLVYHPSITIDHANELEGTQTISQTVMSTSNKIYSDSHAESLVDFGCLFKNNSRTDLSWEDTEKWDNDTYYYWLHPDKVSYNVLDFPCSTTPCGQKSKFKMSTYALIFVVTLKCTGHIFLRKQSKGCGRTYSHLIFFGYQEQQKLI